MNSAVLNIALLAFVIVTWGYSWILMKIGLGYAKPYTFAAWRCCIGAAALLAYVWWKGPEWPALRKLPDYLAVGFFQTTLLFGLMLLGMERITAGKTSVLLYTMPVWTILIVHFYLKERLNAGKWAGVALGSLGILSILGFDVITQQDLKIFTGELFVVGAAVSWAVANIWMKTRMAGEDIYTVSALQMTLGTLLLLFIALPHGVLDVRWTAYSIYILLFTGIIASAVDFTIWFYLLKKLDINITTFSSMLVPVLGLLFDWLMLGNPLDMGVIAGGIFILAGIYMVSKK